ncbi:hypothetical protein, unlikely [Trypanosoma brucei gambiense DAL972]|uniref:Uncharacterized protein n=1 Tax=Trypanosoma brucei gambiense (strain MHOM/CI/86/DAL972) TaxID=679716 RepID=D0A0E8_TRYB9|nr:hypothetical protein, unlikely [Trypanosoma brucei gambiense DAL972]CBH16706.1 hypothetical protein, unlikely [Trypanosoma brucei gambiense DAL972]|eukprot:XP_011778970.1 hypothetical protein, unlikely [Trypanosoma brucei gambiense DAL972]
MVCFPFFFTAFLLFFFGYFLFPTSSPVTRHYSGSRGEVFENSHGFFSPFPLSSLHHHIYIYIYIYIYALSIVCIRMHAKLYTHAPFFFHLIAFSRPWGYLQRCAYYRFYYDYLFNLLNSVNTGLWWASPPCLPILIMFSVIFTFVILSLLLLTVSRI